MPYALGAALFETLAVTPQLHTVFFGGGSPSLLPAPQLGRILDALHRAFGIAPGAEVSMELDPGAATLLR